MAVHHRKLLVEEVGGGVGVVHEDIVHGVSVLAHFDGFQKESVAYKSQFLILSEEHLFAVYEMDCAFCTIFLVGDGVVDAVVEYHAVLENLADRCAFVAGGSREDFLGSFQLNINRAGKEVATGAEDEFGRDKRILGSAVG